MLDNKTMTDKPDYRGYRFPPEVIARAGSVTLSASIVEDTPMTKTPSYSGYRFPPDIIAHAVWLYHLYVANC